jgi:WD40 repeat protein
VVDVFLHGDSVFCISVKPEQSEIFASACENGQVSLYDLRISNTGDYCVLLIKTLTNHILNCIFLFVKDPIILSSTVHGSAYQACCFNPTNSSLIATANIESGIQLIDLRYTNK